MALNSYGVEVINAGYPGANSSQIRARFQNDAIDRKAELIILMCGTNDVLNSYNSVALERYRENLSAMIKSAKSNNIKIIIAEIPDANQEYLTSRHAKGFLRFK